MIDHAPIRSQSPYESLHSAAVPGYRDLNLSNSIIVLRFSKSLFNSNPVVGRRMIQLCGVGGKSRQLYYSDAFPSEQFENIIQGTRFPMSIRARQVLRICNPGGGGATIYTAQLWVTQLSSEHIDWI